MGENALISVVIPVYNGENYVAEMVEMLKAQTYQNFEVILVNDGSTDHTAEMIEKETAGDSRFVLVNKENSGPSSSRNLGLTRCKGEYIAFIDADDYVYPEYLEYLYGLIQKYDAEIACCNYRKVNRGDALPTMKKDAAEYVYTKIEALQNMYRKEKITGYPYLKLFKKSVVEKLVFPIHITYAEDIVFVDGAIKRSNKVVYGDQILYVYYQNRDSITHSVNVEELKKAWEYNQVYFTKDIKEKYPELEKAVCCKQFVMALDLCCRIRSYDRKFYKELRYYAKGLAKTVANDKDNTSLQRILAFFAGISGRFTVFLCRIFNYVKEKTGFQMKKAV